MGAAMVAIKRKGNTMAVKFTETERPIIKLLRNTKKRIGEKAALRLLELAVAQFRTRDFDAFYERAKEVNAYVDGVKRGTKNSDSHYDNAKDLYYRNCIREDHGLGPENGKTDDDEYDQ